MSTFENSVFCTRCSTRVQSAATCSNCGAALQEQAPEAPREPVVEIERKAKPQAMPAKSPAAVEVVPTNVLSIVSLALSFLGFCFIASILGHVALSQIKKSGEQGRILAIVGIVVGYVTTALIAVVIALVMLFELLWNDYWKMWGF